MWETGTRARPFCVVSNLIKKHLFVEVFVAFWGSNLYRWWVYRKPSTCLAKDPEFRLWNGVYAIENDDCPVDAMSLEVVCFYLDTVGDDDYTLKNMNTVLVTQLAGLSGYWIIFQSRLMCVLKCASSSSFRSFGRFDIRGAERYLQMTVFISAGPT